MNKVCVVYVCVCVCVLVSWKEAKVSALICVTGLGFNIAGGRTTEHVPGDDGIFITKIIPGGAAAEEGSLTIGDRIVKVNDHSMVGITHVEAVDILISTSSNVELHFERDPQLNRTVGSTAGPTVFKFNTIQPVSGENRVQILPYQERLVTFQ